MGLFSHLLLAKEFVVDEHPEAVFDSGFREQTGGDLLHAVAEMLLSQNQLQELNEALKASQNNGSSREFDQFIKRFLARMDGFDRILDAFRSMEPTGEVNNWLRSLEGLYYKLQDDLKNVGLTPIEVLGKNVDLNCMEVVDYRPTSEHRNNIVIHEMKRGYRYKGKVLRDAQVVVAHNEGR